MGNPTVKGMSALKRLVAYLHGNMDHGFMWQKNGQGEGFMDYLAGCCQLDNDSLNQSRSKFEVEVFTNSIWAGCNVTHKSTTSFMVFLCGNVVTLSSCEAQLFARTAAVGDSIQFPLFYVFLWEESMEYDQKVTLTLRTDSSSAKSARQRRGSVVENT